MNIQQHNTETKGAFRAMDNETPAGEMTYVWAGTDKFIIDHTEVDEAYNGKGIGKQLLMKAVAFARENNLKIIPLCPFAKSLFDKIPEIGDVLN